MTFGNFVNARKLRDVKKIVGMATTLRNGSHDRNCDCHRDRRISDHAMGCDV